MRVGNSLKPPVFMSTKNKATTNTRPIAVVEYGSALYDAVVRLRQDVLRSPLGLTFTRDDLARDKDGIMFTMFGDENPINALACLQLFVPTSSSTSPPSIKIRQMAVDPNQQGQGLGQRMMWFAETWATQNNHNRITLNARVTAIPFYEKLGYTVSSDEFTEVGIPHVVMEKKLAQQ